MGTRATGTIAQRWLRCGLVAALLLTAGALVHPATTVRAATDTVTTCAATGPGSLPAVLAAAAAGDTITFAQDCTDANAITLTTVLAPAQDVTIDATAPPHAVTIDGGGKVTLFFVEYPITLELRGLTIAHGYGNVGGAILNSGTVNVVSTTFIGNSAIWGGAINSEAGTVNVVNCAFSGNATRGAYHGVPLNDMGGAIINRGGTLSVVGSTFSDNHTRNGGAIFSMGTLVVTGSSFSGNSAVSGGAIVSAGTLNLTGSTFSTNTANNGGAISAVGTVNVVNSTFAANTTTNNGGAISTGGTVSVVGSTFFGNTATSNGGAIDHANGSTLRLALSVVAGNTAGFDPDISGPINTDGGGNVVGNTAGSSGLAAPTDKLNVDPLLAPLGDNGGAVQTFALMPGSPASGIAPCPTDPITMLPLATDARGVARPQGASGKCDAGSYQGA